MNQKEQKVGMSKRIHLPGCPLENFTIEDQWNDYRTSNSGVRARKTFKLMNELIIMKLGHSGNAQWII